MDQKPGRHRPGNGLCQTYVGARQNMERLDRHADDDRAGRIHIPGSGVHGQGCEGRQFRIRPADRRPAAPIPAQKEPAQHRRRCRPQHHIRIRIEQDQHLQPRIQQFAAVSVVAKLELRRCERRLRPNRREQPDVLVRPEFGANSSSGNRILFSNPISANSRTFRNLRTELPQGSHGRSVCNVR